LSSVSWAKFRLSPVSASGSRKWSAGHWLCNKPAGHLRAGTSYTSTGPTPTSAPTLLAAWSQTPFHSTRTDKKDVTTESRRDGEYGHCDAGSARVHAKHRLKFPGGTRHDAEPSPFQKEMNLLGFVRLRQADTHARDTVRRSAAAFPTSLSSCLPSGQAGSI